MTTLIDLTIASNLVAGNRDILQLMITVGIIWFVAWLFTLFFTESLGRKIIYGVGAFGTIIVILRFLGLV